MQKTNAIHLAFVLATTAAASSARDAKPLLPWFDAQEGLSGLCDGRSAVIKERTCGTSVYCNAVNKGLRIDGSYTSPQACFEAHEEPPVNGLRAWVDPSPDVPPHGCTGREIAIDHFECGTIVACLAVDQGKLVEGSYSSTQDCFNKFDLPQRVKVGRAGQGANAAEGGRKEVNPLDYLQEALSKLKCTVEA